MFVAEAAAAASYVLFVRLNRIQLHLTFQSQLPAGAANDHRQHDRLSINKCLLFEWRLLQSDNTNNKPNKFNLGARHLRVDEMKRKVAAPSGRRRHPQ